MCPACKGPYRRLAVRGDAHGPTEFQDLTVEEIRCRSCGHRARVRDILIWQEEPFGIHVMLRRDV